MALTTKPNLLAREIGAQLQSYIQMSMPFRAWTFSFLPKATTIQWEVQAM